MPEPYIGQRVRTPGRRDFFPDFIIPAGYLGTVVHIERCKDGIVGVNVKFDDRIEGCDTTVFDPETGDYVVHDEVYWTIHHFPGEDFLTNFWREVEPV
jgi:hypothetical protein